MSALYTFILVLQALVAAAMIGVILMQKSEGGGLGVGGSPAGFLSARGAADFLSRATAILATIFVALSIALAVLATVGHRASQIDVEAANKAAVPSPTVPAGPPLQTGPILPGAPAPGTPPAGGILPAAPAAPTGQAPQGGVPIQQ